MANPTGSGYTDSPVTEDLFEIERYQKGLSDFISKCNTPMTIAIQGDWGSGKTSLMEMIQKDLKDCKDVQTVWFNTWQYSQFNMSENLAISFLGAISAKLKTDDESSRKTLMNTILSVAKIGAVIAIDKFSSRLADKTEEYFEQNSDTKTDANFTIANQVEQLKTQFEAVVKSACGENGRAVFFIDDLDRLAPFKAVEILEVLKLFLDSKRCVFVLAIDYGVVQRGVKDKYGSDFDDEKARAFFDKIIQVPFKMPIADYKINKFVKECFGDIGITNLDEDTLNSYVEMIELSIGNNPRSMKRLFNSYLLLAKIAKEDLVKNDESKKLLFALLCLQSRYEKIYNYLISNRDNLGAEELNDLRSPDCSVFSTLNMTEKEVATFNSFAEVLVNLIDTNKSKDVDEQEIVPFKEVLSFSAITAGGNDGEQKRKAPDFVDSTDELIFNYGSNNGEKIEKLNKLIKDIKTDFSFSDKPQLKQYSAHFDVVFNIHQQPMFVMTIKERKTGFCVEYYSEKQVMKKADFVQEFLTERGIKLINYGGKNKQYFQFTIKDDNEKDYEDMRKLNKAFYAILN